MIESVNNTAVGWGGFSAWFSRKWSRTERKENKQKESEAGGYDRVIIPPLHAPKWLY